MPGKITELAAQTGAAAATTDLIETVDVSDTSMAATGTNKKMTLAEFGKFAGVQPVADLSGDYGVASGDGGKLYRLTGTAQTIYLTTSLAVGERVDFVCVGGPATFALSGATWDVVPTPSAVARAVGSFVTAVKMGATTWALTGDLA